MPGIDEVLGRAMAVGGARGASIVDYTSGLVVGAVGEWPHGGADAAAAGATEVVRAALDNVGFVGPEEPVADAGGPDAGGTEPPGDRLEDIVLTAVDRYHVLRFIPTRFDGRLFLHLWLGRSTGNLALARHELRRLSEDLIER